jgi:hypothetical protein
LEKGRDGHSRDHISALCYPEQLINRTATHLLTVVAGAIILFAPMPPLLNALVPCGADEGRVEKTRARGRRASAWLGWGTVLLLGALIGVFAFVGEMSEGSGALPLGHLVFVASVFVGLGLAGLVIAYAFLGEPLGLRPRG